MEEVEIRWLNGLPYINKDELRRAVGSSEKRKKVEVKKTLGEILEAYKKERQFRRA